MQVGEWLKGVDIKYKNRNLASRLKYFILLVLSVINSNYYYTSHISNHQLKFKSLQNTHSCDVYVQLQLQSIA